jgi:hypothetical protein
VESRGTQKMWLGCRFVLGKVTGPLHNALRSSRHVSPRASRSQKPSRALRSGLQAGVSFGSAGARKSVPTDSPVELRSSRHGSPRRSGFGLEGSPKSGGSERSAMLGAVEAGHLRTAKKARSLWARIARSASPLQRSPTSVGPSVRLRLEGTWATRRVAWQEDLLTNAGERSPCACGSERWKAPRCAGCRFPSRGAGTLRTSVGETARAETPAPHRSSPMTGGARKVTAGEREAVVPRSRPSLGLHDTRSRRLALRKEGSFTAESLSPE